MYLDHDTATLPFIQNLLTFIDMQFKYNLRLQIKDDRKAL